MREHIKQVLVAAAEAAAEAGTGYLEIRRRYTKVFGNKEAEVIRYCQENPGILNIETVGSGPYKLSIFHIEDRDIQDECYLPFLKKSDKNTKVFAYTAMLKNQPDREDIKELLKELEE